MVRAPFAQIKINVNIDAFSTRTWGPLELGCGEDIRRLYTTTRLVVKFVLHLSSPPKQQRRIGRWNQFVVGTAASYLRSGCVIPTGFCYLVEKRFGMEIGLRVGK